jgi:hypothetical protein
MELCDEKILEDENLAIGSLYCKTGALYRCIKEHIEYLCKFFIYYGLYVVNT